MSGHEITLNRGCSQPGEHDELFAICSSCDKAIWTGSFPAKWHEVALAVAEHLRPEAEAAVKEMLRAMSVKDILKAVRRKP